MARVTVEDCIEKVENRFELVLLASHRARQLSSGGELTIARDRDKNPVVALREIADATLSPEDLKEDLIHSLQKQVEVDESENVAEDQPAITDTRRTVMTESEDKPDQEVTFDRMSEEELLAGIESLVPPEKTEEF